MIEHINELLENNDVMVRINTNWFKLEAISIDDGEMPILVTDEDGEEYSGYDMADIDEFDPIFKGFKGMDKNIIGIA